MEGMTVQIGNMIRFVVWKHFIFFEDCRKWDINMLSHWDLMVHWSSLVYMITYLVVEALSKYNASSLSKSHSTEMLPKCIYFQLKRRCIIFCIHIRLVLGKTNWLKWQNGQIQYITGIMYSASAFCVSFRCAVITGLKRILYCMWGKVAPLSLMRLVITNVRIF